MKESICFWAAGSLNFVGFRSDKRSSSRKYDMQVGSSGKLDCVRIIGKN